MTHPSYGILSKEDFERLQMLPEGQAGKEIRKKDPLWGLTAGDELKPFKIKVTASCTISQSETQTFTVSAPNEEAAKEIVGELADNHSWNNLDENPDDIYMEIIK